MQCAGRQKEGLCSTNCSSLEKAIELQTGELSPGTGVESAFAVESDYGKRMIHPLGELSLREASQGANRGQTAKFRQKTPEIHVCPWFAESGFPREFAANCFFQVHCGETLYPCGSDIRSDSSLKLPGHDFKQHVRSLIESIGGNG